MHLITMKPKRLQSDLCRRSEVSASVQWVQSEQTDGCAVDAVSASSVEPVHHALHHSLQSFLCSVFCAVSAGMLVPYLCSVKWMQAVQ